MTRCPLQTVLSLLTVGFGAEFPAGGCSHVLLSLPHQEWGLWPAAAGRWSGWSPHCSLACGATGHPAVLTLKEETPLVSPLSPTGFPTGDPTWVRSGGEPGAQALPAARARGRHRCWVREPGTSASRIPGPPRALQRSEAMDGGHFPEMVSLLHPLPVCSPARCRSSHRLVLRTG